MKATPSTTLGPQRFVLVFNPDAGGTIRTAITALREKIEALNPQPALTIGTGVLRDYWTLTVPPSQSIECLGDSIKSFFCWSAADFEARLATNADVGVGAGTIPSRDAVR